MESSEKPDNGSIPQLSFDDMLYYAGTEFLAAYGLGDDEDLCEQAYLLLRCGFDIMELVVVGRRMGEDESVKSVVMPEMVARF